jgi:acetylornithine deacetylase/succinyl-diaminopimelate desuccinylase-like protein
VVRDGPALSDAAGQVDPTRVPVRPAPLSARQQEWVGRAFACIDDEAGVRLLGDMVSVPSPTGGERALAELLVGVMRDRGLEAFYQEIDDHRGNAVARLRGTGEGPDLLFYGHLDTTFTGVEDEDFPVVGPDPRPDLLPRARVQDGVLSGLGASNPKGGAACAIMAVDAVRRAGIPLTGDAVVGLVSGGIHKRPIKGVLRTYAGRAYQGFGLGCEYLLKHGTRADFCISTKPGYSVVWEEPGECWFSIQVKGLMCYSGYRHLQTYRNPIDAATKVISGLEAWFPEYTRQNTLGLIAPQGAVGAVEAGWPFKPEMVPAVCTVYADARTNARTDPQDVKRQFGEALAAIQRATPGLDLTWDMVLSVPGSRTEPDSWIIQSCLRAWQAVEQRDHVFARDLSGTTDGNVLRAWGIPTARLGLPALAAPGSDLPPMFDGCRLEDLRRLTRCYVWALIDTCTRSRAETRSGNASTAPP